MVAPIHVYKEYNWKNEGKINNLIHSSATKGPHFCGNNNTCHSNSNGNFCGHAILRI